MSDQESIQLFEDQRIRTAWDHEKEEWYFSIVDVVIPFIKRLVSCISVVMIVKECGI